MIERATAPRLLPEQGPEQLPEAAAGPRNEPPVRQAVGRRPAAVPARAPLPVQVRRLTAFGNRS